MNIQSILTNSILNNINLGSNNTEGENSTSFSSMLDNELNKLNDLNNLNNVSSLSSVEEEFNGTSFSTIVSNAINKVNDAEINANNKIEALIKGEDVEMHEVMLAMQESSLSLQALIEVRNKVVEAYKEINNIQL